MRTLLPSVLALSLAGLSLGVTPAAHAASVNGNLETTASVESSCRIISSGQLNFGAYDPANVNATQELAASTQVKYVCTVGSTVGFEVDAGSNSPDGSSCSDDTPVWQMRSDGGDYLKYGLFYDNSGIPNDTRTYGCGLNKATYQESNSAINPQSIYIQGRVYAGQDVPQGNYNDIVTVSFTF